MNLKGLKEAFFYYTCVVKLFGNIRSKTGRFITNRKEKKLNRKRAVVNMDNAKSAGVLFDATDQKQYNTALEFIKFLESKGIKTQGLGIVNSKELMDFHTEKKGIALFTQKELSYFFKPKNEDANQFLNQEFDLLIDLTLDYYLPIQYTVALSKAKFKVGRFLEENSYYDLMIDISKNKTVSFLIEQMKHYLSIIK